MVNYHSTDQDSLSPLNLVVLVLLFSSWLQLNLLVEVVYLIISPLLEILV
jgi:hypothetical protein